MHSHIYAHIHRYVTELSGTTDDMVQQLATMKKYAFFSGSTRGVFVDFAVRLWICAYIC